METSVVTEVGGTVKEILVQPGAQVRAGQLPIELQ